ncbi:MAG: 3',5'-cyclic-nucleotide phosphodiesterase [Acidobacteria bacterium]|nr:MAG: 3',5'-cyclic-nucleotide phosphodiesterase [Acidobacteriota bacterium]
MEAKLAGRPRWRGHAPGHAAALPGPAASAARARPAGAGMRTIAHISDLHFGRADPAIVAALAHDLKESAPDLVAVSGDLTQRARRREFAAARDFLQGLGLPVLAVPGNHDIPLFDVARRLLQPLDRYHRYIHAEDNPFYVDDEMAVLGLNTARRTTFGDGRLSLSQIAVVRERFERLPPALAKILVTHHPFLPAPAGPRQALVGRGLLGLQACEVCGVDVLLTGHLHRGFTGDVRSHHVAIKRAILVFQAGTAVSTRLRGEANSYNLILLDPPRLSCTVHAWDRHGFRPLAPTRFLNTGGEWQRQE